MIFTSTFTKLLSLTSLVAFLLPFGLSINSHADQTYLIPLSKFSFSPTKAGAVVYGNQDMTLSLTDSTIPSGSTCTFSYRSYGTATAYTTWTSSSNLPYNNSCSVTFPKSLQTSARFDFRLRVTSSGQTIPSGSDFSYFFLYGSFAVLQGSVTPN